MNRSIISHSAVAVCFAIVGWLAGASGHTDSEVSSGPDVKRPRETKHRPLLDIKQARREAPSPNAANNGSSALAASDAGISVLSDGSVRVPPKQLYRVNLNLFDGNANLRRDECNMLGVADDEFEALVDLVERLKIENKARVAAHAVVISESESEVVVKIPSISDGVELADAARRQLDSILGEKSPLMSPFLVRTLADESGSFGGVTLVIRRSRLDEDTYSFEYVEVEDSEAAGLGPDSSFEDFRKNSRRSGSGGYLERFSYVFPD